MQDSTNIVCPSCGGVNRVPRGRNPMEAKCGSCKTPLFSGSPLALNAAQFDRQVGRSDVPVLVDFWAPWCAPCRRTAPEFAKAASLLEPNVRLAKVDTEAQPGIGARFNIRSIPTMVLFRGGTEIARVSGAMNAGQIVSWVQGNVA